MWESSLHPDELELETKDAVVVVVKKTKSKKNSGDDEEESDEEYAEEGEELNESTMVADEQVIVIFLLMFNVYRKKNWARTLNFLFAIFFRHRKTQNSFTNALRVTTFETPCPTTRRRSPRTGSKKTKRSPDYVTLNRM